MDPQLPKTTRRRFLELVGGLAGGAGLAGMGLALPLRRARADGATPKALSQALLERSEFAYISPLLADGRESTCHAELWYAWLDGGVVVTVAKDRWKAAALDRGLSRARVWIGDHGRWKTWFGGRNEAFRAAPHFDARVEKIEDRTMIERLLTVYEQKYPEEIADWRDRMRSGAADGSRVLLHYRPIEPRPVEPRPEST